MNNFSYSPFSSSFLEFWIKLNFQYFREVTDFESVRKNIGSKIKFDSMRMKKKYSANYCADGSHG